MLIINGLKAGTYKSTGHRWPLVYSGRSGVVGIN